MKRTHTATVVLAMVTALIVACASRPGRDGAPGSDGASIEITYVRGQNAHRFVATEELDSARLKSFVDRQLLREVRIDHKRYLDLEEKTLGLVASLERSPATKPLSPCRTPFSVRVKGHGDPRNIEGCRSTEEAAGLGKLIKDFELSLISEKSRPPSP